METRWQYFPRFAPAPLHLIQLVSTFENVIGTIGTPQNQLSSNEVLDEVADGLEALSYIVERGKTRAEKIYRPVLYGKDGSIDKAFEVDAWQESTGTIIEVEAGRAVINHQFLKDFFEACVIQDARYLVIAVCKAYKPASLKTPSNDFEIVTTFMETMFASGRLQIPLEGIMIVGY
jgi:hypothetical protein